MRTKDEIQRDAAEAHKARNAWEGTIEDLNAELASWRTKKAIEAALKHAQEECARANAQIEALLEEWGALLDPSAEPEGGEA